MFSIKNQRIRSRKAKKLAIKKARTQRQKKRERNVRSARSQKLLAQAIENSNIFANTNKAELSPNEPVNVGPNTGSNSNNENIVVLPYTNRELNTVEPSVVRASRQGVRKTIKSKSQKKKLMTRLQRTLKQKQRERAIARSRVAKEAEREREEANLNENANLNYMYNEPEIWYEIHNYEGYTYYYNMEKNLIAWEPPPQAYVVSGEEDEYSGAAFRRLMIKEAREKRKAKKAMAMSMFEKHPKNTFILQIENEMGKITPIDMKALLDYLDKQYRPFTLHLVWIGKDISKSYYYKFEYGKDFEDDNNNNSYNYYNDDWYGYRRRRRYRHKARRGFNVFKFPILEYFEPGLFIKQDLDYDYAYSYFEDEYYLMQKRFVRFLSWAELKPFILNLKEVKEAKKRIEEAKVTAPQKLEQLQLDALKRAYTRFETKTGKDFPVNMQNLLESYMTAKKPVIQYYRNRDNLSHIDTSLFQN